MLAATPALLEAPATAKPKDKTVAPLVIGHRGAAGYRPEHTLASYALAIDLGADYIEPDLVNTKDGQLVARHENEIETTTDVASRQEFADRKTTKIIDLARSASKRTGRTIGIYPETKHPTYFDSIGLSLEEPLVAALERNGYRGQKDPVFVQSFEVGNLQELSRMAKVRLVQLLGGSGQPFDFTAKGDPRTYDDLQTPAGLREIARYADGIGPDKNRVIRVRRPAHSGRRQRWSATPTAWAWWYAPTPSATRASSCRPTSGAAT
ncbi:MAG: glycerophosphodiester phosphodiesterase family protein [Mycobacteriales bacterium]